MAFVSTATNHISKGIENNVTTSNKFTWFQTNFNMPIVDFLIGGTAVKFNGPVNYIGESTTYDLTGFSPGFEICNGEAIFDFDNTTGSGTVVVNTTVTIKWTDTSGNPLNGGVYSAAVSASVPIGFYYEFSFGANIGFQGSEVASSITYNFRSSASGSPNISEVVTAVSFTNVPSITTLASKDIGYMWVEGANLTYVNANQWKHSISGLATGTSGKISGYIWLDGVDNLIHWVGGDGNEYTLPWNVRQFASFYNNSSTSTVFAGTQYAGYVWVDSQFGDTHLGYIGTDGYKYLCGAGANPYA